MSAVPVYLDHSASTPLDPRVLAAMLPHFTDLVGNPSSVDHLHGHAAAQAVEAARAVMATSIQAKPREIIFTSGCTEANNLAILGLAEADPAPRHILTSRIEHPAVLEPCRRLTRAGWEVTQLEVDAEGRVAPDAVAAAIRPDTALVTIMGANNEVGTRQPLAEIGAICRAREVPFHSDLAQAAADAPVDVEALGLTMASFSAHKAYGPKGVGALYVSSRLSRTRLAPVMVGGAQERGWRSGTLNTPGIVGMAEAFRLLRALGDDAPRIAALRDRLWARLSGAIDGIVRNGAIDGLANNLSISIEGVEPLALMRRVRDVVSVSASSACATGKVETSHVLVAMFGDGPRARRALRLSPGRFTTVAEIDRAADAISAAAHELRRLAA